jgi:hypothetical protein
MSKHIVTTCLVAVALGALSALPASAQTETIRTIDMYDSEAGLKYSLLYEEGGYWGSGALFDGGVKICAFGEWRCQVVGELGFHRFGAFEATYLQVAGGLRVGGLTTPRVRTFVQFLVGLQRCCEVNATVYEFGGGINYAMSNALDLQVMADVPFADYPGGVFKQFRISVGLGVPLGRR